MRIRRLRILGVATVLAVVAVLLGIVLYALPPNAAPSVNRIADFVVLNDALFWARDRAPLATFAHFPDTDRENERLRFIAIDEGSLRAPPDGFGAWPWPRSLHGRLLQRLAKAGATIASYDVLFLEPAADRAQDAAFAAGLRAQPTVLGFTATTTTGADPRFGLLPPPPQLAGAARALGFTTVDNPGGWLVGQYLTMTATPDRGTPTVYRSLAAATVEAYAGQRIAAVNAWRARLGDAEIPLDGRGQLIMLPFVTHEHVDQSGGIDALASRAGAANISAPFVQSLPFRDALKADDATLAQFAHGNVVVIGPTAQSLGDFIVTPNGRYPGIFANLRLMDQLMTGTFVRRVPPWLDLALIVLVPLGVGFAVTQLRPSAGVAIAVAVVVLYSLAALALYAYALRWLNLIHVDVATILAALFVALYRTVTEGADKRVKVTVFYSDIRGFTAMSAAMTPEQIYAQLNEYFEEMCRIVFAHGGYVDKFIGDCLMAVFSAPNQRPDDAYHAVLAAWEQQRMIAKLMTRWAAQGRQIFTVGMGLNTGEVVMGNLGSSDRLNYTVIGDNVNTAARLYGVAQGGQIIISESTYAEVKDRFAVNELAPVTVKGKALPLRSFEVVGVLAAGGTAR